MEKKKDTRFWLTTFFEEQEQTKHEYKSFQSQIENNGCLNVNTETGTVKIYTPELAVIFTSKELPARNMDTQTETTINGWEYLKTYIEGYKEGEQFFETEFKVPPNILYGENAEKYVRDIHLNFFHVQHTGLNEGWGYVKKHYPNILTHKAVKEFGYFSGIVNKVEEQVKKYPRLFASFDKCEHNEKPKQTETKDIEKKVYSFNDWIKNEFVFEKGLTEKHVFNDSYQYQKLVNSGKMTYEVLNEIQEAQSQTYEYLINCTLEANERMLNRNAPKSPNFKNSIDQKIKELSEYIEKNESIYRDVISPRLHRGIKKGATYILPEQYLSFQNKEHLDAYLPEFATYFLENDDGNKITPEINQVHAKMEVNVRWLEKLKAIRDNNYNLSIYQNEAPKSNQETPKKFIANEYAMAYIFDLGASSKQIPTNRTEGGNDKKAITQAGIELYHFDKTKDTFYRAVRHVATFDLNRRQDLINISQNWLEAVKALSKDWKKTEKYLREKKLLGE
jgi:hypothetical protein